MKRPLILFGAGIPAAIICFIALTILFVPGRELQEVFARALAREGYTLQSRSFGLAFPLGIRSSGVEIGTEKGAVIRLDKASVKLRVLPLFLGKIVFGYHGSIGKGIIDGEFSPLKKGSLKFEMAGVRLEDIPFFQTVTGAQAKGELRGKGTIKGKQAAASGELQLAVKDAQLQGVKIGPMPLPDAAYKTVQGMLKISGGRANLESLTFDGEGLYTRLKGDLPLLTPLSASPLNLTLELMPRPEFLEKQKFVFLLLLKYQTSPGHYQLPVRGTLGKPSIM
ncbi:type II secretion system protein GspN, putative [Geotalea daltonii FRC-32]|uniref:Type II secretion system protein GspN, putative n=1 Tax=Geotalea daltonii (strain DSM 22248 / JCM 15807 / FRC-32) TaxID=316067 RepID=B9M1V2_GEODF|nr:type II secretion system protein GspN [Geotalea daltonii]ACM19248.1 type II secretion system protein GspN, putative [Geotalea daltonii FRC-32]